MKFWQSLIAILGIGLVFSSQAFAAKLCKEILDSSGIHSAIEKSNDSRATQASAAAYALTVLHPSLMDEDEATYREVMRLLFASWEGGKGPLGGMYFRDNLARTKGSLAPLNGRDNVAEIAIYSKPLPQTQETMTVLLRLSEVGGQSVAELVFQTDGYRKALVEYRKANRVKKMFLSKGLQKAADNVRGLLDSKLEVGSTIKRARRLTQNLIGTGFTKFVEPSLIYSEENEEWVIPLNGQTSETFTENFTIQGAVVMAALIARDLFGDSWPVLPSESSGASESTSSRLTRGTRI